MPRASDAGEPLAAWPAIPIAIGAAVAIVAGQLLAPAASHAQLFAVRASQVAGLFAATFALFFWRRRRFTLRVRDPAPRTRGDVLWSVRPWASYLVGWGLPISLGVAAASLDGHPIGVASYIGALFVSVTFWGVIWLETREDARALRAILRAPRASAGDDGWGQRCGTIVKGDLQRRRTHRETTTTTHGTGHVRDAMSGQLHTVETTSTATFYRASESGGGGKVTVQMGDRTIEVDISSQGRWGTARRRIQNLTLTESLRTDDQVLVVGEIHNGTMRGAKPGRLYVVGSATGDVATIVRRELLLHRCAMLGFAVVVSAEVFFLLTN